MKKAILLVSMVLFFLSLKAQNWVQFDQTKPSGSEPVITLLQSNGQLTSLNIKVPGMWETSISQDGDNFKKLSLPNYATTAENGKAAIPMISTLVAIPPNSDVEISSTSISEFELSGYNVYPYQDIAIGETKPFQIDQEFYSSSNLYPALTCKNGLPAIFRDYRIVKIEFCPFQFNPKTQKLKVIEEIEINLDYQGISTISPQSYFRNKISPTTNQLYKNLIINHNPNNFTIDYCTPKRILIVTDEYYLNSSVMLQKYAEWKRVKGFYVDIETLDESNPERDEYEVKNIISNYYFNHFESDCYILLIGNPEESDQNYMPMHQYPDLHTVPIYSDHFYACLDGNSGDFFPEVSVGRITASSSAFPQSPLEKVELVLQRSIEYEKNPPIGNWINNHALVAGNEDATQIQYESNDKISLMLDNYNQSYSKIYGDANIMATNQMLKNEIEQGVSMLNYMGHGNLYSWPNWTYFPQESWKIENTYSLQNNSMRPIIYSHSCRSATIHTETQSLCEAFLTSPNGGAIGVYGNTYLEGWGTSPTFDLAMWRATFPSSIYDERLYIASEIQDYADAHILTLWPEPGTPDSYDAYVTTAEAIWLGDPALEIWTENPIDIFMQINYASNSVVVVNGLGNPLENVKVVFNDNVNYETKLTDSQGQATSSFSIDSHTKISANGHEYLPAYTTILEQDEAWYADQIIRGNVIVPNGVTLTLNESISMPKYSTLIIEDGANLVLSNNATILIGEDSEISIGGNAVVKGANQNNYIEVHGDIYVSNSARFDSESPIASWKGLKVLNHSKNLSLNGVHFKNCGFESEISDILLENINIENGFAVLTHGNIKLSNCALQNSYIKAENPFYRESSVEISYCQINNCINENAKAAILIDGYPNYDIHNNTISNNAVDGIYCNNSGYLYSKQFITDNTISFNSSSHDNVAGIRIYNSYSEISTKNKITNNDFGIICLNNSNIRIKGNKYSQTVNNTQEIIDNNVNQIYSTSNSFPVYCQYNAIIYESNVSPLVYFDGSSFSPLDVRNNFWGNNFNPNIDLYPSFAYNYLPIWELDYSGQNPSEEEAMYNQAVDQMNNEDYPIAVATTKSLIQEYPESEFSKAGLKLLLVIESLRNGNFNQLKNYYNNPQVQNNENIRKLASRLANQCNIKVENYEEAIQWFEGIIQDPETLEDSIFAIIDLEYTYLLMENSGKDAGYVGKLAQFKPESREAFQNHRRELMNLLVGEGSYQPSNYERLIKESRLITNSPNPFRNNTNIEFKVEEPAQVKVCIYNIAGQKVLTLVDEYKTTGVYSSEIKASQLTEGIYLYTLELNGNIAERNKMVLMK